MKIRSTVALALTAALIACGSDTAPDSAGDIGYDGPPVFAVAPTFQALLMFRQPPVVNGHAVLRVAQGGGSTILEITMDGKAMDGSDQRFKLTGLVPDPSRGGSFPVKGGQVSSFDARIRPTEGFLGIALLDGNELVVADDGEVVLEPTGNGVVKGQADLRTRRGMIRLRFEVAVPRAEQAR
jgi:hypothetical protein